jgi:RHS repeat-associated protein
VAKYTYDAFGNTTASGAAAELNQYRFSTKEEIKGLYYYGYRFYSPGLGRWINRDPIQEAGGINIYAFVGNQSINQIDENGLLGVVITGELNAEAGVGPYLSVGGGAEYGRGWFSGGKCGGGPNDEEVFDYFLFANGLGKKLVDNSKPSQTAKGVPATWEDQWTVGGMAGFGVNICITNADCGFEFNNQQNQQTLGVTLPLKPINISGSVSWGTSPNGRMIYTACFTPGDWLGLFGGQGGGGYHHKPTSVDLSRFFHNLPGFF